MRIGHIVACDRNHGIGLNNSIPWNNKSDMKRFKEHTTLSGIVFMGHNTYKSLPFKDGLPNRKNIVLTNKKIPNTVNTSFVNSIEEGIKYAELYFESKGKLDSGILYIIGGGMMYDITKGIIDFIDISYIYNYSGLCDTHYVIPDNFKLVSSYRDVAGDVTHRLYHYN